MKHIRAIGTVGYEKVNVYYKVLGTMKKVLDRQEQNCRKTTEGSIAMTAERSLIKVELD